MKSVGIIGRGGFGVLMQGQLKGFCEVRTFDISDSEETLKRVCDSDIVVFAVPFSALEEAAQNATPYIKPGTLIVDVTSIKRKPLEILSRIFPNNQIIGTHPIFGPQTVARLGMKGQPIVVCNVSATDELFAKIKNFLEQRLELRVIEKDPETHDREMAYIQGLSHFIGRAINNLGIKEYETETFSYHQLIELKDLVKKDSWELFKTIQESNEYAHSVRKEFLDELHRLDNELEKQE